MEKIIISICWVGLLLTPIVYAIAVSNIRV